MHKGDESDCFHIGWLPNQQKSRAKDRCRYSEHKWEELGLRCRALGPQGNLQKLEVPAAYAMWGIPPLTQASSVGEPPQ